MSQLTAEEFEERYAKCKQHADGIAAVKVPAEAREQLGQTILVGKCPRCSTPMALDGPGRQLCRSCHLWLEFVQEG